MKTHRRGTLAIALMMAWPLSLGAQQPKPERYGSSKDQLFHVALVIADDGTGASETQPLPQAVRKALDDVRDFLPFSRYRLLDSGIGRVKSHGKISLRGPDNQLYAAHIAFRDDQDGKSFLIDNFSLTEERDPHRERKLLPPGVAPDPAEQSLVASFRISLGETVVVGSSRLHGDDRAIIVFLTAVP
jgi:hypothetical protein